MSDQSELEREAFEADAGPYGFDLTRDETSLSGEPWTEYRDSGTGHRWAGWLAARNPHQVPAQGMQLVPSEPTSEMLDRAVAFALMISLSSKYRWTDYMRDLWARFLDLPAAGQKETEG